MFIPKNNQIPTKDAVTVTHYVSLQLPIGNIPLNHPLANTKHLGAVPHPQFCREAASWSFATHSGKIEYSTYLLSLKQYLPLRQFLAFGHVSHLNCFNVVSIVLLHCQFANLLILLATPTPFKRIGYSVRMTIHLGRNLHIRASRRRYLS